MATYTVTYKSPELEEIKIGALAADVIQNNTLGALSLVYGADANGTIKAGASIGVVNPGDSVTLDSAGDVYAVNTRTGSESTIPTLIVA